MPENFQNFREGLADNWDSVICDEKRYVKMY